MLGNVNQYYIFNYEVLHKLMKKHSLSADEKEILNNRNIYSKKKL